VAKTKARNTKSNALVSYLRDTRAELRKVHWPTRQEAWNLTKIVLGVTVSMAIFMGLLDRLFSLELRLLIERNAIAIGILVVVMAASVVAVVLVNRRAA